MNERLTRVGPGTPAGELFRRYWQPFAAVAQMQDRNTLRVRLLGEDLVLFRGAPGEYGLVGELCPHRRASLYYGVPEPAGIRCSYHGWLFDRAGKCLEQPAEPANSTFKDRVRTTAYPVREMGGLFWTYMGPGEPPILPRHDYFVQPNTLRMIGKTDLECNWLQCMENSLDPTHSEWLHSWFGIYLRTGKPKSDRGELMQARHAKIGFDVFEYGIVKRRYYQGGSEEDNDWKIGHPVIFPNILKVSNTFQIRVPVDDENTLHYLYTAVRYDGVEAPRQDVVPLYEYPNKESNGDLAVRWVLQQDMMAWVTQGRIADRTVEHLGSSDRGIMLYRQVVEEMISRVEAGADPLGVFRDCPDEQINIPIDEMTPALTPTSVRALNRVSFTTSDTGNRDDETRLAGEVIEKQMRTGPTSLSPVLDDWIRMRLQNLANQQKAAAAESGS
jgi:5,5'-dehydrodivanillate O-demethylase oxygenase subunit